MFENIFDNNDANCYLNKEYFNHLVSINKIKKHPVFDWIYVSENGDVLSNWCNANKVRVLQQYLVRGGYKAIKFCNNTTKKQKTYCVHRLVAETWLDNPDNLSDVDHIDYNRSNNHYTNLQWLSHKDNCKKRIINDTYNHKYGVALLNNDNSVAKFFKSIKEGAEFVGGKQSSLRQKLLGRYANGVYKGAKWELVNIEDFNKLEKEVVGFKY